MSRANDFMERPASELMVDLHVFVVPPELWRDHLRSAVNQVINETVSAGFLRVLPETTVYGLREEIEAQLGYDVIPRDYVFLKSVGRALTRVKPKQEVMLKAKSFLPPQAYSPEIYILEATPEVRNIPFSGTSSELSDPRYRGTNGYDPYDSQRSTGRSDFSGREPIPPIQRNQNVNTQTGDTPLPPLSASPPHSARQEDTSLIEPSSQPGDGAILPPLSATPPHSPDTHSSRQKHEQRQAKYTNNTSEDSGISDGVDERERRRLEDLLRKEKEEEAQRRRQAENDEADRRRREWEEEEKRRQEERRRREEEDRRREEEEEDEEEERRRWEEEQRRKEDEEAMRMRYENQNRDSNRNLDEERRRQEEDEREKQDEERRRKEEDQRRPSNERFDSPPPPPPREESVDAAAEKSRLLAELENVKEQRQDMEKKREELVKKAKALQAKTHHRRNQARDMWKKKYFEEKKRTTPLEEQCSKLRQELDSLHRRIMSVLEGTKEGARKLGESKPSQQSNLKIQATKIQHDIEDFQRRVENIKMKLTSEMKLRNQAETELRALRAELTQKKIHVTLTRVTQPYNALTGSKEQSTPRKAALITPKS